MKRIKFLSLVFCCLVIGKVTAQLSVVADEIKATYAVGDAMNFVVSTSQSDPIYYEILYDRFTPPIKTGTVGQSTGTEILIPFSTNEPGVVLCRVVQNNKTAYAGASFSPFDITNIEAAPNDLDAFWESAKAELAAIPIDPVISFEETHEYASSYRINFATVDGRRVYGFLSIPDGPGPFPAILTLPPFGTAANLVEPEWTVAERGGALSLTISIHNTEPDVEDPLAYQPDIINDRDSLYYKNAVLAGVRAIDYLQSRADFNGNLGVSGVSQGGGLAMLIAGVDQRVKILAQSNAALSQHAGFNYDRASGFPYFLRKSSTEVATNSHFLETLDATRYIDAVHLAKRFKGPSLHAISYIDSICPPATVFAAFNQMTGSKVLLHARNLGHDHPVEYTNGRLAFFRAHFPAMNMPPWPWPDTSTGYVVDAGDGFDIPVEENVMLNGTAKLDGQSNPAWSTLWEKVDGPGEVTFSDPTDANTMVQFSEAGTYQLRFTATDDYTEEAAKYFSMQDLIEIIVLEPLLATNDFEKSTFSLHPNPNQGQFFLTADQPIGQDAQLSIYNLHGELIQHWSSFAFDDRVELDLGDLAAGVYLLKLETAENISIKRVVLGE